MLNFNPEDAINLLISNIQTLTKYFQSVNLAYNNWTNNKMVYRSYKPHVGGLSPNNVKYNKAQLKYLGKLANGMNYGELSNNLEKYGLRDIDMYFIGDLMAARVVYEIYQKYKTINKYKTQGLVYNNFQYIMLPSFLEKHYNFIPSYNSKKKQKVETSHLINIFNNHKFDLFKKYYTYLTNTKYNGVPNEIKYKLNGSSSPSNTLFSKYNGVSNGSSSSSNKLFSMGVSFASTLLYSGSTNLYTITATISGNNKLNLTILPNFTLLTRAEELQNKHVLLFDGDSSTPENYCNLYEVNLQPLLDDPNIKTDDNKHYYLQMPKTGPWKYTFDLNNPVFNITKPISNTNFNIGIMNVNNSHSIFHIYTKSSDKQECNLDNYDPNNNTPLPPSCYFTFSDKDYSYLSGDNNKKIEFDSTSDKDNYQWKIIDTSNNIYYTNSDAAKKFYNTKTGYVPDSNSLPLMIPMQKWIKKSNVFSIVSVSVSVSANTITIDYTLGFDDIFSNCN